MNKEQHIKALRRAIEIQKSRLPNLPKIVKISEQKFGSKDPFGIDWSKGLDITVRSTLSEIKRLERQIDELEKE